MAEGARVGLLPAGVEDHGGSLVAISPGGESGELRPDLGGDAFAGAHRPVHVAVPDRCRLGPGPVQEADGLAQGPAVFGPAAGRHQAAVAAAGPLLFGPDPLDEALRPARPLA